MSENEAALDQSKILTNSKIEQTVQIKNHACKFSQLLNQFEIQAQQQSQEHFQQQPHKQFSAIQNTPKQRQYSQAQSWHPLEQAEIKIQQFLKPQQIVSQPLKCLPLPKVECLFQNAIQIIKQQAPMPGNAVKEQEALFIKNHQKKSGLSVYQTVKLMLVQELQKHYPIIEQFMLDFSLFNKNSNYLKEGKLAILLEKLFINNRTESINEIIDQMVEVSEQLCKSLLASLSEQENEQYLLIVNQYNQRLDKGKNLNDTSKGFSRFADFMRKYPMNSFIAIKLDLLSYFFINNANYQMEYGKLPNDVVVPSILSKLLKIDKEVIEGLRVSFEDKWHYVSMDHYDNFKELVILISLVAIKQKVEDNEQRKIHSIKQKTPKLSKHTRISQDFTFKFSRLAFQTGGTLIKNIPTLKRLEVIQVSKNIINLQSYQQQTKLILHAKNKYVISFNQLIILLQKILYEREQFLNQYVQQLRLQEGIKQLPWCFYSPKNQRFQTPLKTLSECKIHHYQLYKKDNYLANELSKMLVQRIKTLSDFTKAAIQWHIIRTKREFIFIHRLEYSQNRIYKTQNKYDSVGILILGIARGKILFANFYQKKAPLTDLQYSKKIQNIFDEQLNIGINFGAILYQFDLLRRNFDLKVFSELRKYFLQKLKALCYLSNSAKQFQLHYIFDFHVRNWLRKRKPIRKQIFLDIIKHKAASTAKAMGKILKTQKFI